MKAVTLFRPREFNPLENAFTGFDRYLDSFFGDNFLSPSERVFNRPPSVDVYENEKAYTIEAELPGYDEKDIEIRLDGNKLTIESKRNLGSRNLDSKDHVSSDSGEKEAEKKDDTKTGSNYLIKERRVSSFSRTFKLPENADTEGITASFRNGVLLLEIKKKAETQARVIQIGG